MHDVNDGSGGGLYAGAFYDANDSGYYLDPNGTSYMNVIYNGIIYDHDSTWYLDLNSASRTAGMNAYFTGLSNMYRMGVSNGWGAYEGFGISNSDNGANATFEVNVNGNGDWTATGMNSNARKYEWYCNYTKMMDLDEGGHLRTRGAQWEWNGFSDADLKTNLQVIDNALEKISQISGYTYEFTEDSPYRNNDIEERTHGAGLIAQEVEAVLPVLVDEDWVGGEYNRYFKTLNYNGVHGLTVQGIKELKGYHDTLEDRVAALESRLEQLESRIQNLENQ